MANTKYGERVLDLYSGIADRSTSANEREQVALDLIADVLASLVPHYTDAKGAVALGQQAVDWYSDEAYNADTRTLEERAQDDPVADWLIGKEMGL